MNTDYIRSLLKKSNDLSKKKKIALAVLLMLVLVASISPVINSNSLPVIVLQEQDFSQTVSGTGRIVAANDVLIKSEIAGKIKEIVRSPGESVQGGETLLLFSTEEAEAQYEQAKANYNAALSNYRFLREVQFPQAAESLKQQQLESEEAFAQRDKDEELFAAGAISRTAWEESQKNSEIFASRFRSAELSYQALQPGGAQSENALQQLNSAEAALKIAEEKFNKHTILAPFAGEILKYYPRPGEWVAVGANLLSFADPASFYVSLELDERFAALLSEGQKALVRINNTGQRIEAKVAHVGRLVDREKGTIEVELAFTGKHRDLIKELTVQAEIYLRREERGLIIPASLLYSRSPLTVLLLNDGVIESREISAEAINLTDFLVIEGLASGDRLVLPEAGYSPEDKIGFKRIKEVDAP